MGSWEVGKWLSKPEVLGGFEREGTQQDTGLSELVPCHQHTPASPHILWLKMSR